MTDLNRLTVSEAVKGIAARRFTAEALMQACLDRVAERDDAVRAWAHLDPEQALTAAREADEARVSGASPGPLHGVPVGVKDIIDTADMPTEHGSALFEGRQPAADARCVALLRAAGAIVMGKTVTTELANTAPSKTRNPHDIEHTPGGSSAGSGAAVADGQALGALGTQTGGSVIRPASFNGVYGLKPTIGLIPRAGVLLQSHTLDTIGVSGRSVADLALLANTLSRPEPDDDFSYTGYREDLSAALARRSAGAPRFAFLKTPAWPDADPEARQAIEAFTKGLGEHCRDEALPPPFDRVLSLHATVFGAENLFYYGPFAEERPERMTRNLLQRLEGAKRFTARDYVEAIVQRQRTLSVLDELLEHYDAILCLAACGSAPRGFETTGNPAFNSPWTYLGVPSCSLPLLEVNGLPLGVQLVGQRGGEGSLLRAAGWLDRWARKS